MFVQKAPAATIDVPTTGSVTVTAKYIGSNGKAGLVVQPAALTLDVLTDKVVRLTVANAPASITMVDHTESNATALFGDDMTVTPVWESGKTGTALSYKPASGDGYVVSTPASLDFSEGYTANERIEIVLEATVGTQKISTSIFPTMVTGE